MFPVMCHLVSKDVTEKVIMIVAYNALPSRMLTFELCTDIKMDDPYPLQHRIYGVHDL